MRFDEQFVHGALANVSILYNVVESEYRFCIDSRHVRPGDFFVALLGVHCDGHDFIKEAFERGAAGCLLAYDKKAVLNTVPKKIRDQSFIIAVTVAGFLYMHEKYDKDVVAQTSHKIPDAFMDKIEVIQMDKNGYPKTRLSSPKLVHFPNDITAVESFS